MSISTSLRLALTTAALCAAASTADARPRRVVILDFDGPRRLADTGKSSVVSVLGEHYDVVAPKRWETARAAAAQQSHGPASWSKAAKQAGVDAVIEGWVQDEGRRKILNVVVREAKNGREFDTITVRIDGKNGMTSEGLRQLRASLDEVLDWIDTGQNEVSPALPVVLPATRAAKPEAPRSADDARPRAQRVALDDDDAIGDDEAPRRRSQRLARSGPEAGEPADDARDPADAAARPAARAEVAAPPARVAPPVKVSTAEREAREIEVLFPPSSDERTQLLGAQAEHVPQKTSRFQVDVGGYVGSHSLTWQAEPDSQVQQLAGSATKGFALNIAAYPFPTRAVDGILSGVGLTGSVHHSAGSNIEFDNADAGTIEQYVVNQNGWELGLHYRFPISGLVALDGGAFYGNQTTEFVDAAPEFEVPDTKYAYLGAGAHLDLSVTDRALIGFGARYFTVLDTGDLSSLEFYGPASATGLGLEASFLIPLPASMYVRGQLAYQRISLELSGGGTIADEEAITSGTDSLITGAVNVGVAF